MAAKQGFLMYYSKGDAIGTKVSVRYRRSGRLSGVVVKRGSTVEQTRLGIQLSSGKTVGGMLFADDFVGIIVIQRKACRSF